MLAMLIGYAMLCCAAAPRRPAARARGRPARAGPPVHAATRVNRGQRRRRVRAGPHTVMLYSSTSGSAGVRLTGWHVSWAGGEKQHSAPPCATVVAFFAGPVTDSRHM